MRIGVIGAGNIGGTVGALWLRAGHTVRFGSRDPGRLADRVAALGPQSSAGDLQDAASFGEALFCAAPYGIWPELALLIRAATAGKLVMDAANPYPNRDGAFATAALEAAKGSGVPVAALLPGAHYVRAFNSVYWATLRDQAHRPDPRLAIPLAGDDNAALELAARLVRDAGFDPVIVGPLVLAAEFDVGAPTYNNPQTADALTRLLGLASPG